MTIRYLVTTIILVHTLAVISNGSEYIYYQLADIH